MYVDRTLTYNSTGKVALSALLGSIYPAFTVATLFFPATNAGNVGVGDSAMAALPVTAYPAESNFSYPLASSGHPWLAGEIYLWFDTSGDKVHVRGNFL